MSDFAMQLSDAGIACLYEYWASLRGDRQMPGRRDVDPLEVPRGYLPSLMLIDVLHDPRRYRYRLVGTNVVGATGQDRTGRYFDEVPFFKEHPAVIQEYETVVETHQPMHSLEPFTNLINGSVYEVDRLLLPLSNDEWRVDTVLVLFQFNTGPYAVRLPITSSKAPSHSWTRLGAQPGIRSGGM
jgi:hypothetical protein